ncbi:MAG: hypothetical protein IKV73_03205 [Clostridia bacterium]|nr:hypothetical protein [Clostridia bacterium]
MKKQAFIFIILAGLLWGTSGIFVHYLAPFGFSSLQLVFFRTVVSTLVKSLSYIPSAALCSFWVQCFCSAEVMDK